VDRFSHIQYDSGKYATAPYSGRGRQLFILFSRLINYSGETSYKTYTPGKGGSTDLPIAHLHLAYQSTTLTALALPPQLQFAILLYPFLPIISSRPNQLPNTPVLHIDDWLII